MPTIRAQSHTKMEAILMEDGEFDNWSLDHLYGQRQQNGDIMDGLDSELVRATNTNERMKIVDQMMNLRLENDTLDSLMEKKRMEEP